MQPRVILDIAFLGHAYDASAARRGVERVTGQLFDGLVTAQQCDLSFVATSHLAGAFDFLASRNISPREKLHFSPLQLSLSRQARKLSATVHRSIQNRSLPARARRRVLAGAASFCSRGEPYLSSAWLTQAEIYHSPHTRFPPAVIAAVGLKKFITFHDFIPLKNPEFFPRHSKSSMDGALACLTPENFAFCVSETTRNDALSLSRIPPEHVFVTPLAADGKLFHPVSDAARISACLLRYGIPEAPYLLALSAHDRHKNFTHLIDCFGTLVEAGELPGTNLVIVGPNPGRNPETAAALAKFPRARHRVIIAGFVPDEYLAPIYSGATAFLFPSLAEGFGIPPLEAMQCGLPVIASNTTSMPEVIGNAGILLPPTDKDAWCQAMINLSADAGLRAALRHKSLQRCKLFSWSRFIEATLRGYRAACR